MPEYALSLFKILALVAAKIERIQWDLWQGLLGVKKPHLVGWKTACSPKEEWGLGLQPIGLMDKALLRKWLWRFGVGNQRPWWSIISSKYGEDFVGWLIKKPTGPYVCGLWRGIFKGAGSFSKLTSFKVGKGDHASFLTGFVVLRQASFCAFPRPFFLVLH